MMKRNFCITLAESFQQAGYVTAHIGKWHLGPEPYDPFHHGFDIDIPHTPAPSPLPDGFFVSWPGEIEPGSVNSKHIVSSVDIYPTLLDMCGSSLSQTSCLTVRVSLLP